MRVRGLFPLVTLLCLVAPAAAGATLYDTSAASIMCNTFMGTVAAKPLLTMTGHSDTVLTIKGTLGGCAVIGAIPDTPALQVLSGKMTAKLTVIGDGSCISLVSGFQSRGNFVFKWKTLTGQELDFPSTTFTPDSGGLLAGTVTVGAGTYGTFTSTGTLATGSAFPGGMPGFFVASVEDVYNMLGLCCTDPASCSPVSPGIKLLHIGIGQFLM